ncbi:MAG: fumarate hydratase C-terminal domain-containing protein, partial [Deltaproteobacteria bacterium]|nr:fumarate hydratase C-terminal domain-containing protein [Deltaproteobacteria bacterium]
TPIDREEIRELHAGDAVLISGLALTGRDTALKYMVETLIEGGKPLTTADQQIDAELREILAGGVIYHSGPIVKKENGRWSFVSAGPTTSARAEIYQDKVIAAFGLRVVIGKGGMGPRTLAACQQQGAVYLHAIGGAGVYNAARVTEVLDVFKEKELGLPEAMWKIRLDGLMGIVTMDAHGRSLHRELAATWDERLAGLTGK